MCLSTRSFLTCSLKAMILLCCSTMVFQWSTLTGLMVSVFVVLSLWAKLIFSLAITGKRSVVIPHLGTDQA
eukprot:15523-Karenia_brevis.AAC.1